MDIPLDARVIDDSEGSRFLVADSDAQHSFFLGRSITCDGTRVVRVGARLSCQAGQEDRAAASPRVTHLYIPLEHSADDSADAEILRSPALTLTPLTQHGSVACRSAPSKEFQRVMERFTQDVGPLITVSAGKPIAVLLHYQGAWARASVTPQLLGLSGDSQRSAYREEVISEEGSGVSCVCNTSGSCPKSGKWPATWCDASNCQSCTMNY